MIFYVINKVSSILTIANKTKKQATKSDFLVIFLKSNETEIIIKQIVIKAINFIYSTS